MAEILLVWQLGAGGFRRKAVLKRIHPHLAQDPEFSEMFLNEAALAAGLAHPNIVHIYELLEDDEGNHYISMEYVRGKTLHDTLRQARQQSRRMPLDCVLFIRRPRSSIGARTVSEALHDLAIDSLDMGRDGTSQHRPRSSSADRQAECQGTAAHRVVVDPTRRQGLPQIPQKVADCTITFTASA